MKVLLIGSGGREHALAWKISRSPLVKQVFTAPGNGGTARLAKSKNIPVKADDIANLLKFAKEEKVDLTVVGPEDPLSKGIVDLFSREGLKIFGPSQKASMLESSKAYAKEFMRKNAIPTPGFGIFEDYEGCLTALKGYSPPYVIKADGLALGKGVSICNTLEEAKAELRSFMIDRSLGQAGTRIVLDRFIKGFELSYIAISDGKNLVPLAPSQDNKRLLDGDLGPNTGGMGAYSPIPRIDKKTEDRIVKNIMKKTISSMDRQKTPFKGTIYAGLIFENEEPLVLEYNVRFGDPETQPLLFRMKSDIVPLLLASIEGDLAGHKIEWEDKFSICIVIASGGYPGPYKKGLPIAGPLDIGENDEDVMVFHAGTVLDSGKILTSGGRVLGVCAKHKDFITARSKALEIAERIRFEGAHYRKDIGSKIL